MMNDITINTLEATIAKTMTWCWPVCTRLKTKLIMDELCMQAMGGIVRAWSGYMGQITGEKNEKMDKMTHIGP